VALPLRHPGPGVAPHQVRFFLWACLFFAGGETAFRGETVALWLFDEPVGLSPGSVLNDAGPKHYSLMLGRGAEIAPGKFGHALRPIAPAARAIRRSHAQESGGDETVGLRARAPSPSDTGPRGKGEDAPFAALFSNGKKHARRADSVNATDSRLNLGAHDWTVEAWLFLDRNASAEGTLLEIGSGAPGETRLLTRLSVVPQEDAFALVSLSPSPDEASGVVTNRIEYPNPEGPPSGMAFVRTTTLALAGGALPRATWFHVALVHTAESGAIRLFIDGRQQAVAALNVMALPHGGEAYVSIGCDARWQTPLPGAVDELRISDHAVYTTDFAIPPSFSPPDSDEPPRRQKATCRSAGEVVAQARSRSSFSPR
jgi:hypothetical protein